MLRPAHRRRAATWVALLALVLATLAPSVSHALASVRGELAPWAVICTSASDWPRSRDDGSPAGSRTALDHVLEHCPFCSLHATDLAMPPAPPTGPGVQVELRHALSWRPQAAWTVARAWARAQPRAPPAQA